MLTHTFSKVQTPDILTLTVLVDYRVVNPQLSTKFLEFDRYFGVPLDTCICSAFPASIAKKPYIFVMFKGVRTPCPHPLWIRPWRLCA